MNRNPLTACAAAALLSLAAAGAASGAPGQPNFMPAIYADGQAWGTKATTELPAPGSNNVQSFDAPYVITNSNNPGSQRPVSEAGPRNPNYNGGRWFAHTVVWTPERLAAGEVPILTSYNDILTHRDAGHLMIAEGSPAAGSPDYFQRPLLPVK